MTYGCIGHPLSHSFSPVIHRFLSDMDYTLLDLPEKDLESFFKKREFAGINVTIPYKQRVIPFLDELSDDARRARAVNTVINRGGILRGENTDIAGLTALLRHADISLAEKNVLILGGGGAASCASVVAEAEGAASCLFVSRHPSAENEIGYEEIPSVCESTDVLINATPVGMFPETDDLPVSPDVFPRLSGVIDLIYHPLRTRLILRAREMGIPAEGGLYMLTAQAKRAEELFFGKALPDDLTESVYRRCLAQKSNIVLIGMPTSGKTTVGKLLASALSRPFFDTDDLFAETFGITPAQCIRDEGEARFREKESEIVRDVSRRTGSVIATGGGVPLIAENRESLRMNGTVYWLDRSFELLEPAEDRPLASDPRKLKTLCEERTDVYRRFADRTANANHSPREICETIERDFFLC